MPDEPVITESEWMAELDKIKDGIELGTLTEEEYKFIDYARSGEQKIPWETIIILYNKRFNHTCKKRNTLSDRYFKAKAQYNNPE